MSVAAALVRKRGAWEQELQTLCDRLITELLDAGAGTKPRADAWRNLFAAVSPWLERWSRTDSSLYRAGLRSEDDWRAVLVRAVERIAKKDYANLRSYLLSCEERRVAGTLGRTPFEAWLRRLVKFAAGDEVTRYLSVKRIEPAGGAQTIERLGARQPASKQSLITDIDVKQRSAVIRMALGELKEDQKCALVRRVDGASYEEIGNALAISRDDALLLVRSAKACLRRGLRRARQPLAQG